VHQRYRGVMHKLPNWLLYDPNILSSVLQNVTWQDYFLQVSGWYICWSFIYLIVFVLFTVSRYQLLVYGWLCGPWLLFSWDCNSKFNHDKLVCCCFSFFFPFTSPQLIFLLENMFCTLCTKPLWRCILWYSCDSETKYQKEYCFQVVVDEVWVTCDCELI
jgi:hypothetical protein